MSDLENVGPQFGDETGRGLREKSFRMNYPIRCALHLRYFFQNAQVVEKDGEAPTSSVGTSDSDRNSFSACSVHIMADTASSSISRLARSSKTPVQDLGASSSSRSAPGTVFLTTSLMLVNRLVYSAEAPSIPHSGLNGPNCSLNEGLPGRCLSGFERGPQPS